MVVTVAGFVNKSCGGVGGEQRLMVVMSEHMHRPVVHDVVVVAVLSWGMVTYGGSDSDSIFRETFGGVWWCHWWVGCCTTWLPNVILRGDRGECHGFWCVFSRFDDYMELIPRIAIIKSFIFHVSKEHKSRQIRPIGELKWDTSWHTQAVHHGDRLIMYCACAAGVSEACIGGGELGLHAE